MVKNAFWLILKAIFVLKILKALLFGIVEKALDVDVAAGNQTVTIHILPNIWRSKGSQTIKFGQFIEF